MPLDTERDLKSFLPVMGVQIKDAQLVCPNRNLAQSSGLISKPPPEARNPFIPRRHRPPVGEAYQWSLAVSRRYSARSPLDNAAHSCGASLAQPGVRSISVDDSHAVVHSSRHWRRWVRGFRR